mmetsp:Transcript_57555/g.162331  ORF Transcript_57555/g.162331 Transcript_57555/m.162331 type:complete len:189 (-) Transcript_57555:14-580(-)
MAVSARLFAAALPLAAMALSHSSGAGKCCTTKTTDQDGRGWKAEWHPTEYCLGIFPWKEAHCAAEVTLTSADRPHVPYPKKALCDDLKRKVVDGLAAAIFEKCGGGGAGPDSTGTSLTATAEFMDQKAKPRATAIIDNLQKKLGAFTAVHYSVIGGTTPRVLMICFADSHCDMLNKEADCEFQSLTKA